MAPLYRSIGLQSIIIDHNTEQEILWIVTNLITPHTLFSPILLLYLVQPESAIQSAEPENPTLKLNMKWIG